MRMSDEDWQAVLDVNLTAAMRLCRGRDARHDEGALGADRQHLVHRRRHRQSGAGELCRLQGRADRHDQVLAAEVASRGITANASRRASSPRR
jgi:3-oxoacyl-[acyl-carrier protein] reductase